MTPIGGEVTQFDSGLPVRPLADFVQMWAKNSVVNFAAMNSWGVGFWKFGFLIEYVEQVRRVKNIR